MRRALIAAAVALAIPLAAHADPCAAPRVDVADWPIVRSANVPGFSLRLPRAFTRDGAANDSAASARWSDAARARLSLSHPSSIVTSALPSSDGHTAYARCEERIGAATAVIVSYGDSGTFVVHARIRWPDGEELAVRADAADRERFEQLLTAVRTIRRAGA